MDQLLEESYSLLETANERYGDELPPGDLYSVVHFALLWQILDDVNTIKALLFDVMTEDGEFDEERIVGPET
jgi:hypothetical protein